MNKKSFRSLASGSASLAGLFGLAYSIAFLGANTLLAAAFMMLGGLAAIVAMVALYQRLRDTESSFALLALVLSAAAAAGAVIHGGYDLSNAINPPAALNLDLPSAIDPRGLLTFGMAGLGLLLISWLMANTKGYPSGLSKLGYLSAALMIVLYLGRLIILQATNPAIVFPALAEGFIVNPVWYIWLGSVLRKKN